MIPHYNHRVCCLKPLKPYLPSGNQAWLANIFVDINLDGATGIFEPATWLMTPKGISISFPAFQIPKKLNFLTSSNNTLLFNTLNIWCLT